MDLIEVLEEKIVSSQPTRFILGITGPPGAGKSTVAEKLLHRWNEKHHSTGVIVPMDGYHYSNEDLEKSGTLELKGIPSTFRAELFVDKIQQIKSSPEKTHLCPRFDRSIEASIADAIAVTPDHKFVIVEGNYLLLPTAPWSKLKTLFDTVWYIDCDPTLLDKRLMNRHQEAGKTESAAREKVQSTDAPNAALVATTCSFADLVLHSEDLLTD